jgi:hypothetical protein
VFSVRASEDSPKIKWFRGDKRIENQGRFIIREAKDGGVWIKMSIFYYLLLVLNCLSDVE